jgi:hypothetical protein
MHTWHIFKSLVLVSPNLRYVVEAGQIPHAHGLDFLKNVYLFGRCKRGHKTILKSSSFFPFFFFFFFFSFSKSFLIYKDSEH